MAKKKQKETYSYKGWLNSDNFLKRAFAVWGYGISAVLIFYGIFLGAMLLFALLSAIFA